MKISILTAVWKRPEVFELFVKGITPLLELADVKVIVAGSEGEKSRKMVESAGYEYIEIDNQPLSKKMQSTADRAREYELDYVFCMGSDDVIQPDLFKLYLSTAEDGRDYIGCLDWYFYELHTGRATYWGGYRERYNKGILCGAGRMLSRNILNKMDWKLWTGHDAVLDTSMDINLKRHKYYSQSSIRLTDYGLYGVDLKSKVNMTPMAMWDNTHLASPVVLREALPHLELPELFIPRESVSVMDLRRMVGKWYGVLGSHGSGTAQAQIVRNCINDLEKLLE